MRLLKRLEERRPARWLTVGIELLRACSFEEQRRAEHMLEQLRKKVQRNWRTQGHENSIVITPPEIRETTIAFYAFPTQLAANRKEVAGDLAHQILNETDRNRCIIISRNVDHWDREYEAIQVFETPRSE
jgi:predicted class III extradiol MEMO1 family dioxygenase